MHDIMTLLKQSVSILSTSQDHDTLTSHAVPLRSIPSWKGPICTRKVNTSSRKYEFKSRLAATKYNPENENLKLSKMRSSTQQIGEKSVQLQCTQSSKFTGPQLLQSQSSSEAKQILLRPTHQICAKGASLPSVLIWPNVW